MAAGAEDVRRPLAAVALVAAALLALLTWLVLARWSPLETADQAVLDAVHAWARESPVTVNGALALDWIGAWPARTVLVIATVVVLLAVGRRRWALGVAVVAGLAPLVTEVLKRLVDRARPVWDAPLATESSPSFPSGHATGGLAVWWVCAIALGLAARDRWGWSDRRTAAVVAPWLAFGVLIGLSRVVLGVHHPSDVVAGWLVALAVGASVLAALAPSARRASAPRDAALDRAS